MNLIGAMLVRNEAGWWLSQTVEQLVQVCSRVVVVDDASTDETPLICHQLGAIVHGSPRPLWETNELSQRQRLWGLAVEQAGPGGWILCLDADELLEPRAIEELPSIAALAEQHACDGLAFGLYDMWSPTYYRDDHLWTAHKRPWIMAVRYDPKRTYTWKETPLHCGRFPLNACTKYCGTGLRLKHMGWSRPGDRREKYERYRRSDPEGKWGIPEQYESILDPEPNLVEF